MTLSEGEWRERRIGFLVASLVVAGPVAGTLGPHRAIADSQHIMAEGW